MPWLTGAALCEQLRAPVILSHPSQARGIVGLLGRLAGSVGIERAMRLPETVASTVSDTVDTVEVTSLARTALLDLLVALRRGLAAAPPPASINARSFIRELRAGTGELIEACMNTKETSLASALEFRLLELIGGEGGVGTCGSILSRVLLRLPRRGGKGKDDLVHQLTLFILLVRSFDVDASGALEDAVESTVEALGKSVVDNAAGVLEVLTVVVNRDNDEFDIGHRTAAVLGRMLVPLTKLCRPSGGLVSCRALELLDAVITARHFGQAGSTALQRACARLTDILFAAVRSGNREVTIRAQHVLYALATRAEMAALVVGQLVDAVVSAQNARLFARLDRREVPRTAAIEHATAMSATSTSKSTALLAGNRAGLTNRRGYFYTGTIGRGLDRQSKVPSNRYCVSSESATGLGTVGLVLETILGCLSPMGHEALALKLVAQLTPHAAVPSMQQYLELLPQLSSFPRDIALCRKVDDNPMLWHILPIAASNPRQFCRCSELIIGLLASTIGRWRAFGLANDRITSFTTMPYDKAVAIAADPHSAGHHALARDNHQLLETTLALLETIRVGLLAPPPLCDVGGFAQVLTASDMVRVLMLLFRYVARNQPVPEQFIPPADKAASQWRRQFPRALDEAEHIAPLRELFMDNIETLGPAFALYFPPTKVELFE